MNTTEKQDNKSQQSNENKPRVWICGQVGKNHIEEIKELSKVFKYFDGAVWSINYSLEDLADQYPTSLATFLFGVMQQNALAGEVFVTRWSGLHYIAPSIIVQSGHFQMGDWILMIDAPELLKEEFAKDIKNKVQEWDKKGVVAAGWNRVYFFKWNPQLNFNGSPHQGPINLIEGKYENFADESKVKYEEKCCHFGDFILNTRKLENSHILHPMKYTFCYDISNEMTLRYQKPEDWRIHEAQRQIFNMWFSKNYGKRTLDRLQIFMASLGKSIPEDPQILKYFDFEPIYQDFYRYKILGHSLDDILKTRGKWTFAENYGKAN